MKELLKESYAKTKEATGIDPRGRGFTRLVTNQSNFSTYVNTLSEGLSDSDKVGFKMMAENTRHAILAENSQYQLNPYESLAVPILRVYYPKLIAKDLVNVTPIDKPEVVRPFLKAYFRKNSDAAGTFPYQFPSTGTDISRGPTVGVSATALALPGATDVLAVASLTNSNSHIEKDFKIISVTDTTSNAVTVSVAPDIQGYFHFTATINGVAHVISGAVDYKNGTLTYSSDTSYTESITYSTTLSLEENSINPKIDFTLTKIQLRARDRQITGEWTVPFEQDARQLYDLDIQSELVNVIGEQIALDIDKEVVTALISANSTQNPASHSETFDKNPPASFLLGRKAWYENIIEKLSKLSAQVYESSFLGSANTIACNPLDAAILENLNGYEFQGGSTEGGTVNYRATVGNGKWNVLTSSVVPSGSMIVKYRSDDVSKAVYYYAPYVPALLHPYPLGNKPSLTIMSRYATALVRPEGLSVLTITDTA